MYARRAASCSWNYDGRPVSLLTAVADSWFGNQSEGEESRILSCWMMAYAHAHVAEMWVGLRSVAKEHPIEFAGMAHFTILYMVLMEGWHLDEAKEDAEKQKAHRPVIGHSTWASSLYHSSHHFFARKDVPREDAWVARSALRAEHRPAEPKATKGEGQRQRCERRRVRHCTADNRLPVPLHEPVFVPVAPG